MNVTLMRRCVQAAFLCLLVAVPWLVNHGITFISGTLYSMSIGPLDMTDPLSGFQVILLTFSLTSSLLLSMAVPILFTLIFGRIFCGWLCPQNLFSELADMASKKIIRKRLFSAAPSPLSRYIVLVLVLAGCFAVGYPLANLISAPGIISVQIGNLVAAGTIGAEAALIGIILLGEMFILRRFWCNHVCTVGTFLGFFRTGKTLRVSFSEAEHQCIRCDECVSACQLGLNPMAGKIYPQCHVCGDCIAACETATDKANPLSYTFSR
jgi:ferredoxin-type protein NapH